MPDTIHYNVSVLFSTNTPGGGGPSPQTYYLLLETGDYVLTETADKVFLETAP